VVLISRADSTKARLRSLALRLLGAPPDKG
jgi:hypothetical protein